MQFFRNIFRLFQFARIRTQRIYLAFQRFLLRVHPAKLVFLGYLLYLVAGWMLISLPFAQKGPGVGALDNLFTCTSALSTTGLTTVSVSDSYTFFGQIVVLVLIQLGGIGYMTFGSFIILSRKSNLTELRDHIGKTVFSLPASFQIGTFIKSVIYFTAAIEILGAAALYAIFLDACAPEPLWSAIFHSVSAFCTAGFSLFNNSFESFAGNFWLNIVLASLAYLGAIGFIVCLDFWNKISGKSERITLTSRIILWATLWLSVIGTALIFLAEPTIASKPAEDRLLASFFQAMTAFTTVGFNTISIGELSRATVLLIIVLMIIGASPSGTGGGLKTTTISAIIGVMASVVRRRKEVTFWGSPVPLERIWSAVATAGFYPFTLLVGTYFLEMAEPTSFDKNIFEAASALGTVGLRWE